MIKNFFILLFLGFYYLNMQMRNIIQKFQGLFIFCFFFNVSAENVRLRVYDINKMDLKAEQVETGKKGQNKSVYHATKLNFQHRMH